MGHDLHLLESMEINQRVKPVQEIIEGIEWQGVDPDLLTRYCNSCFSCFSSPCAHSLFYQTKASESVFFHLVLGEQSFFSYTFHGILKFYLIIGSPCAFELPMDHILFLLHLDVALAACVLILALSLSKLIIILVSSSSRTDDIMCVLKISDRIQLI